MTVSNKTEPVRRNRRKAREEGGRLQEIIDAAIVVFHRKGYSAASIQEIADEVGLLKGSLYYYIDSKEDLLFAVLNDTYELARAQIDLVQMMEGLSPLERLGEYIKAHVNFVAEHTTKIAIYYSDFDLVGDERKPILVEQRKQFERYIRNLIIEAQEAGEVSRDIDPYMATFLILGAMNWAYTWYRPNGRVSPRKLGELAADMAFNGLRGGSS